MERLRICNARIVNENLVSEGDVLIEQGRIAAIGDNFATGDERVIDAAGRYLLPGMIDHQVNFREPGMTLAADMASGTQAAVAGGITSFLDLPDQARGTTSLEQLEQKRELAQGRSRANFGFYIGASDDNIDVIAALEPEQACAVHLCLGSDVNDARLLDDPTVLEQVFEKSPLMVAAHCEDMPTILENEESYRGIYGDQVPVEFHPVIRSEEACVLSTQFALELAEKFKTRLHLMQVSTASEVELLASGLMQDKSVTANVSVHFLHFSDEDYASRGGLIKENPAIKTPEDRASLIQALLEGRLDLVSSGHEPHELEKKQQDRYFDIPSGLPMVQHALPALLENYHDGIFSLEFIAEKTSHQVAKLFGIQERGYIREGYWADLVLVDTEKGGVATNNNTLSRCNWTPFDGFKFRSGIAATWVNGGLVWSEGSLQRVPAQGMALQYQRQV